MHAMNIAEFSLVILIIYLSFVSSSSSVHNNLSSELVRESKLKEGKLHAYKVAKGGTSGGHTVPRSGGNDGDSRTPKQGGAKVIPAYVAGAAGVNNRHRSSNGSFNRIEFPTLLIITFLYAPLLHLCLVI
ncbi:uncharacterized protein LOC129293068 [Prosopis cineraria]|uniref:uncharacterized protein LOC129293068 n=1 Tax=Prosopis cineraria TaxID=364024 RepID=UPI00240E9FAE|nr:uncharacterized protein LOC129293068 [Prosopis cineraria]